MVRTLVNVISYCSEMPTTSKSESGEQLSSDKSGRPRSRSSPSMSIHGANARSQAIRGCRLSSE